MHTNSHSLALRGSLARTGTPLALSLHHSHRHVPSVGLILLALACPAFACLGTETAGTAASTIALAGGTALGKRQVEPDTRVRPKIRRSESTQEEGAHEEAVQGGPSQRSQSDSQGREEDGEEADKMEDEMEDEEATPEEADEDGAPVGGKGQRTYPMKRWTAPYLHDRMVQLIPLLMQLGFLQLEAWIVNEPVIQDETFAMMMYGVRNDGWQLPSASSSANADLLTAVVALSAVLRHADFWIDHDTLRQICQRPVDALLAYQVCRSLNSPNPSLI